MQIFVYEYTCAHSGDDFEVAGPLQAEGWAILRALADDFRRLPNVEVVCVLHESFPWTPHGCACRRLAEGEEERAFRELARRADCSVLIAPETGEILLERCRWAELETATLLSPSSEAIETTGDKLALYHLWQSRGVPTPPAILITSELAVDTLTFPAMIKPRFGAGSAATYRVEDPKQLPGALAKCDLQNEHGDLLIQPYMHGVPASIAFIENEGVSVRLQPARQFFSGDGALKYLGGAIPLADHLAARALALGKKAIAGIPGLRGYFGVDLILGSDLSGREDYAIEINPRLTTSYVGLRALSESNLAKAMVDVVLGRQEPGLRWKPGVVRFHADGSVAFAATP
jgi:predicted ATP-grasp superfamily ATP-dependent carboligase